MGKVTAVDDISFAIPKGSTLCLVGESGSGKSVTAMSILGMIDKPGEIFRGEIYFNSKDLLQMKKKELNSIRGGDIAMIFQNPMTSLNPSYTIGYQLKESLKLHQNLSGKELHAKAVQAMSLVSIPSPEERLRDYPFKLSGGMRQRVMIAMAMACEPQLLIADEPTTALDVTIQAQILKLMNDLKDEKGTTILFITHDLGVVAQMADYIAVMYAGRIMETATAIDLFRTPAHPYTEGLLKAIPSGKHTKGELYTIPENVPDLHKLPSGCSFHPRCPYADDICKEQVPDLKEIKDGHCSACFKSQGFI